MTEGVDSVREFEDSLSYRLVGMDRGAPTFCTGSVSSRVGGQRSQANARRRLRLIMRWVVLFRVVYAKQVDLVRRSTARPYVTLATEGANACCPCNGGGELEEDVRKKYWCVGLLGSGRGKGYRRSDWTTQSNICSTG